MSAGLIPGLLNLITGIWSKLYLLRPDPLCGIRLHGHSRQDDQSVILSVENSLLS